MLCVTAKRATLDRHIAHRSVRSKWRRNSRHLRKSRRQRSRSPRSSTRPSGAGTWVRLGVAGTPTARPPLRLGRPHPRAGHHHHHHHHHHLVRRPGHRLLRSPDHRVGPRGRRGVPSPRPGSGGRAVASLRWALPPLAAVAILRRIRLARLRSDRRRREGHSSWGSAPWCLSRLSQVAS